MPKQLVTVQKSAEEEGSGQRSLETTGSKPGLIEELAPDLSPPWALPMVFEFQGSSFTYDERVIRLDATVEIFQRVIFGRLDDLEIEMAHERAYPKTDPSVDAGGMQWRVTLSYRGSKTLRYSYVLSGKAENLSTRRARTLVPLVLGGVQAQKSALKELLSTKASRTEGGDILELRTSQSKQDVGKGLLTLLDKVLNEDA